jgi:hypothetical protein
MIMELCRDGLRKWDKIKQASATTRQKRERFWDGIYEEIADSRVLASRAKSQVFS